MNYTITRDTILLVDLAQQSCTDCGLQWFDHAVIETIYRPGGGVRVELGCPRLLPRYTIGRWSRAELTANYQRMFPEWPKMIERRKDK
jgi:hypothetical protein